MENAELELELARAKNLKNNKDAWKKVRISGISKKDIQDAVANGGELVMKDNPPPGAPTGSVSNLISFGKHKGKTYNWVYKNDVSWITWAFENIRGFKEKAIAANYKQS